ncbi:MAG: dihydrodipicolinate synthase family protein [Lysobacter sp.]|nr:dihydrodipicolinate synthase family protein [Lysobacter sp.]
MQALPCPWHGVIPAATTQFDEGLAVDLPATRRVQDALVRDGVHGMIVIGTVGENNSLEREEKLAVIASAAEAAGGRIPVIAGVSELTTPRACAFAEAAEKAGATGLMVLPAMVYVPAEHELEAHFRAVAASTSLPVMLYNNPPAYRVSIGARTLANLADVPNIVAVKESAPDPRRFTDLHNTCGDRYVLFAGLDDVALEGLVLGARGWVSGLTNVFPRESIALWEAVQRGDLATALKIYRWFMPLLHLDAEHDLVQSIKLAEAVMGRGSERVRMPRMPLQGERRAEVIRLVEAAEAARPALGL